MRLFSNLQPATCVVKHDPDYLFDFVCSDPFGAGCLVGAEGPLTLVVCCSAERILVRTCCSGGRVGHQAERGREESRVQPARGGSYCLQSQESRFRKHVPW